MSSGKYVVGNICDGYFVGEAAVLFPDYIAHSTVANRLFEGPCIGGGFYSVNDGVVEVWGHSVSAKVASRPEDVVLVKRALGMQYS